MATNPASVLELPKARWVTDDVAMLYDMATRFLSEEIAPKYDAFEEAEIFDRESWKKAGANGLLCASMPEQYGGSGGTFAHESAIIEAISHVGVDGFGIALHNSIVAPYILHYGSEEQKKKWLPRMASGELIGAIAMTEPGAGSDLQGVKTRAEKDGNHYRISGSKTFITNGQLANLIIVVTKTDPAKGAKGTSLIVVETDEVEGFQRGRNLDKIGLKSNNLQPARPCRGPGLRPADAAAAAGAPADRHHRDLDDRTGARPDHRLRQGAQGVRQVDPRVPEHPVQARRAEDGGDDRPRLL